MVDELFMQGPVQIIPFSNSATDQAKMRCQSAGNSVYDHNFGKINHGRGKNIRCWRFFVKRLRDKRFGICQVFIRGLFGTASKLSEAIPNKYRINSE
jgi:hypothetical protein